MSSICQERENRDRRASLQIAEIWPEKILPFLPVKIKIRLPVNSISQNTRIPCIMA
jgi:hypothetical protein